MITISTRFDTVSVAFIVTTERITVATSRPDIPPRQFVSTRIGERFQDHEQASMRMTVVPDFAMHALFLAIEYTLDDLNMESGYAEKVYGELTGVL